MTAPRPPAGESLRIWAMLLGILAVLAVILFVFWEYQTHRPHPTTPPAVTSPGPVRN